MREGASGCHPKRTLTLTPLARSHRHLPARLLLLSTRHREQDPHRVPNGDKWMVRRSSRVTEALMKHPSVRELYHYWIAQRGLRAAPERSDIEPSAIRRALADTFILACDA